MEWRHGGGVSTCWLLGLLAIAPLARAVDGAWQGSGTQLILTQRGGAVVSPALRPRRPPPADAVVTSVSWHLESERPLAAGVRLAICQGERCFFPDGLAGRSLALTGQPAGNSVTLWLKWSGRGAIVPPVRLLHYRLLINYQSAGRSVVTR
ncbi:flagellar protein FlhE [Candidatus Sodalis endolongispinus]|uniref:Flagellar protein FlhE n=1 Tax=Candidatus Sodalis endolongispinus TaxID=2812662 RepID=A0ABS5Y8D5_9GAMM|nr:flagellar protein FlhE [Candidatus Sodalis endolongispinus]MBT9431197.1 flagellar protein FlhE [Candidatus Sodalis endolongispinus]